MLYLCKCRVSYTLGYIIFKYFVWQKSSDLIMSGADYLRETGSLLVHLGVSVTSQGWSFFHYMTKKCTWFHRKNMLPYKNNSPAWKISTPSVILSQEISAPGSIFFLGNKYSFRKYALPKLSCKQTGIRYYYAKAFKRIRVVLCY